ncbi:unnamed protein product [Symbiodinium sp. CCMP2592]|nr:unnamed protein product [Symbiodinium sp. CCMP2592]
MDKNVPATKAARRPRPGLCARRTRRKASAKQKPRIYRFNGEVLPQTSTRRHPTPKDLLRRLEHTCGVSMYRIRLIQDGQMLRASGKRPFASAKSIQMLLLPYVQDNSSRDVLQSLETANRTQNTAALRELLWRPVDPNTAFPRYLPRPITALELALLSAGPRTETILSTLLKAKARPNDPRNQGMLCLAVQQNDSKTLQLLLRHRADPNSSTNRITPLDIASQLPHQEQEPKAALMLLAARAEIQGMLQDENSWTLEPRRKDYLDYAPPRSLASTVCLVRAAAGLPDHTHLQQITLRDWQSCCSTHQAYCACERTRVRVVQIVFPPWLQRPAVFVLEHALYLCSRC